MSLSLLGGGVRCGGSGVEKLEQFIATETITEILDSECAHYPRAWGVHRRFELHGLDDGELIAGADLLARLHRETHDASKGGENLHAPQLNNARTSR